MVIVFKVWKKDEIDLMLIVENITFRVLEQYTPFVL